MIAYLLLDILQLYMRAFILGFCVSFVCRLLEYFTVNIIVTCIDLGPGQVTIICTLHVLELLDTCIQI